MRDKLERITGKKIDLARFRKNMNEDLKRRIGKEIIYVGV